MAILNNISVDGVVYNLAGGMNTEDATALASDILLGKTAYARGSKLEGTIASKEAQTYTPTTSNQTIAAGQYLSGTQTIKGDSNLKAANIKSGVSIFGVKGSLDFVMPSDYHLFIGCNVSGNREANVTYTCPYDGTYQVYLTFYGHDSDNAGGYNASIKKNTSTVRSASDNGNLNVSWSDELSCVAGDKIYIKYGGYAPRCGSHCVYMV